MRIVHLLCTDVVVTAKKMPMSKALYIVNIVHYLTSLQVKGLITSEAYRDRIADTNSRILPFLGGTQARDVTHV
jgi:hypothetical protein